MKHYAYQLAGKHRTCFPHFSIKKWLASKPLHSAPTPYVTALLHQKRKKKAQQKEVPEENWGTHYPGYRTSGQWGKGLEL